MRTFLTLVALGLSVPLVVEAQTLDDVLDQIDPPAQRPVTQPSRGLPSRAAPPSLPTADVGPAPTHIRERGEFDPSLFEDPSLPAVHPDRLEEGLAFYASLQALIERAPETPLSGRVTFATSLFSSVASEAE